MVPNGFHPLALAVAGYLPFLMGGGIVYRFPLGSYVQANKKEKFISHGSVVFSVQSYGFSYILIGNLPFGNEIAPWIIKEDKGPAFFIFNEVNRVIFLVLIFHSHSFSLFGGGQIP